jgi:hypothetical protein
LYQGPPSKPQKVKKILHTHQAENNLAPGYPTRRIHRQGQPSYPRRKKLTQSFVVSASFNIHPVQGLFLFASGVSRFWKSKM